MRILGVVSSSSREVPNAPTIGIATNIGTGRAYNNGAATVTFTAPTFDGGLPITGYTVTSSPGGFTGTGGASPITVTGLQSGVAYTFTVVATNSRGNSTASAASNSITATTVPQAPTVSVADVGTGRAFNNGAATVTITGGATGGSAITSYSAVSSPGSFSASGSSPLTVTGLASNTSYTYSVTATNANGTSTATVSGAVTATTVPQAPTIGTATAGNAQATVTFTGNATGGKAISTYTATSSPGSITGSSASSPITVTGLSNGTAYTFTVTATNANGTSSASAASNSVTPVVPVTYWMQRYGDASQANLGVSLSADSSGNTYAFTEGNVAGISSQSNSPSFRYSFISTQTAKIKAIQSNDTYTVIGFDNASNALIGYVALFNNSNGSVVWQNSLTSSTYTGSGATTRIFGAYIDASSNVYVIGQSRLSSTAGNFQYWLAKFNSSGTLQWSRIMGVNSNNGGFISGCAIDSSGNVFTSIASTSLGQAIVKLDSSGTTQWINSYQQTSPSTLLLTLPRGTNGNQTLAVDSSGNLLFLSSNGYAINTYQLAVTKVNTSGVVQWSAVTDVNGNSILNPYSLAIDSSNNTYAAFEGQDSANNGYLKHNSSGTLLLQRTWSSGAAMFAYNMKTDANALYAGLRSFGGTAGTNPYIFKVPLDGSRTGTYNFGGGISVNYATPSYGTRSSTVSANGNPGFTMSASQPFAVASSSISFTSYSSMFNVATPTTVTL